MEVNIVDTLVESLMEELNCETVFKIPIFGGIPVYESVVVTWIIMLAVLVLCVLLVKNLSIENPSRKQLVLETALRQLGWQGRAVLPSGRTDSGVHALGQVISFNLDWKHGDGALRNALNAGLPADISVRQVSQVDPAFHPRYDALSRTYRYAIYRSEARNPLLDRFAWRQTSLPALEGMNKAAAELIGVHDFSAFGKAAISRTWNSNCYNINRRRLMGAWLPPLWRPKPS